MPTLLGEHIEWKPPLFVWVYSVPYFLLKDMAMPAEVLFRLPSTFFGAMSTLMVYLIANRMYGKPANAIAALLFMTSPLVVFSSSTIMMESLALFLILATIYLYMAEKTTLGIIALGLLTLTKWLYALVPMIFIVALLLKDRRLPGTCATFIVIPFSLCLYLLMAHLFGSLDNAVMNLAMDISRPAPTLMPVNIIGAMIIGIIVTFPVSAIFLHFAVKLRNELWNERAVFATGALAFVIPISQHFIFWYEVVAVPSLVMFVSKMIADSQKTVLFAVLTGAIVMLNLLTAVAIYPTEEQVSMEVGAFMKGKQVTFIETQYLYDNWEAINRRYLGSEESHLLLEQTNGGILYYRFNDVQDYDNLNSIFTRYENATPESEYVVVHGDAETPEGYTQIWEKAKYTAYKKIS